VIYHNEPLYENYRVLSDRTWLAHYLRRMSFIVFLDLKISNLKKVKLMGKDINFILMSPGVHLNSNCWIVKFHGKQIFDWSNICFWWSRNFSNLFIKNLMREFSKQIELIKVTLVSKDNLNLYVFLKNSESRISKQIFDWSNIGFWWSRNFSNQTDQFINNLMREFSKQIELIYVTLVSKDNLNCHVLLKKSGSRISWKNIWVK